MSAGSFNLRKWNSNSKELLRKIAGEESQVGGCWKVGTRKQP